MKSLSIRYENNQYQWLFLVIMAFIMMGFAVYRSFYILPAKSLYMLMYLIAGIFILAIILTWRPKFTMPLVILSVFFSPDIVIAEIPGRSLNLRIEDGILVSALLAYVIRSAFRRERISIPRTVLDKPILVYLIVGAVSTILGSFLHTVSPVRGMFFFGKRLEYFILFYILCDCVENKKDIKTAILIIFLCTLVISFYNIYMRSIEVESIASRGYSLTKDQDITSEYADMITLIFPIMLAVAIETRSPLYIFITVLGFIPILFQLLDSLVRHAYIGTSAALLFLVIYRYRSLIPVLILSIVYFIARIPVRIMNRIDFLKLELSWFFSTGEFVPGGSFICRITGVRTAITEFLYRPLLGKGLGSFSLAINVSHTQYSQLLLETGVLGLASFFWLIWNALIYSFRCIKITTERLYRGICIGYMAGLVGWLVSSWGAPPFTAIRTMETFIIMTVLVVAVVRNTGKKDIV